MNTDNLNKPDPMAKDSIKGHHKIKVKEMLDDLNSWDTIGRLLRVVDDVDTHIITLTGKDGRKYWVHREDNDE